MKIIIVSNKVGLKLIIKNLSIIKNMKEGSYLYIVFKNKMLNVK